MDGWMDGWMNRWIDALMSCRKWVDEFSRYRWKLLADKHVVSLLYPFTILVVRDQKAKATCQPISLPFSFQP